MPTVTNPNFPRRAARSRRRAAANPRVRVAGRAGARWSCCWALAFWLGLALDWLFEPSPGVRRLAFVVLGGCGAVRRVSLLAAARVRADFRCQRRRCCWNGAFPHLSDHVLTAVDVASPPERAAAYHPELVSQTQQAAAQAGRRASTPDELFNRGPLLRAVGAAVVLVASIGAVRRCCRAMRSASGSSGSR